MTNTLVLVMANTNIKVLVDLKLQLSRSGDVPVI